MVVREEGDVFFGGDERRLLFVFILRGRFGVAAVQWSKFLQQVAELRIGADGDAAAEMDAHFGTVAAAENGAVVDERDTAAEPRGGDGRADARDAAAADDEIELASRKRWRWHGADGRRLATCCEADGVATSVESRQIMQGDDGFSGGNDHGAGYLPFP